MREDGKRDRKVIREVLCPYLCHGVTVKGGVPYQVSLVLSLSSVRSVRVSLD